MDSDSDSSRNAPALYTVTGDVVGQRIVLEKIPFKLIILPHKFVITALSSFALHNSDEANICTNYPNR